MVVDCESPQWTVIMTYSVIFPLIGVLAAQAILPFTISCLCDDSGHRSHTAYRTQRGRRVPNSALTVTQCQ